MSKRLDCPLADGRWVQSVWVLIGSINLDGFDSVGHTVGSQRYSPVSLLKGDSERFFSPPKGDKMRNENHPRIICIQLLSEREEGVFLNDNAASGTHQAWLSECVGCCGMMVVHKCVFVCVERCIYLFSWWCACVRRREGGGWLISDQIIRFAIRAAAAVRGSGRLKHGRRY